MFLARRPLAVATGLALIAAIGLTTSACFPTLDDEEDPRGSAEQRRLCQSYCVEVMEACTGDNAQYPTTEICVTHCAEWAVWPEGEAGNRERNDIACRLTHALAASSGESVGPNCVRAGPTGGNSCGSFCTNYCDLLFLNCTEQPELLMERNDCIRQCQNFPQDGGPQDQFGDTVQCRIYHLTLAAHTPPQSNAIHCPHGAVEPSAFCLDDAPALDHDHHH